MAPILPLLSTVFAVCCDTLRRWWFQVDVADDTWARQAILEVFILCTAGYVLARKGILDKTTQKVDYILVAFTDICLTISVTTATQPPKCLTIYTISTLLQSGFLLITRWTSLLPYNFKWLFSHTISSIAKMRELWIIPIFFVLVTTVSMSVSFTLGWLFGLKRSQRCASSNIHITSSMTSNLN